MVIVGKRAIVFCLSIVLLISSLYADGHVLVNSEDVTGYAISDYAFEVKGRTTKAALQRAIIPTDGDPIWNTEDEFIAALDAKRQILINTQLFLSVSYEYHLSSYIEGVAYYNVVFSIVDSNTFLMLPYPKFDNDETGLLLGAKIKDSNFLGTFGELNFTGYVAQNDGTLQSWDDREDYISLDISDLLLRTSLLNVDIEFLRQKESNPSGTLDFDIDWADIPLKNTTKLYLSTWGTLDSLEEDYEVNYEMGLSGMNIFGTNLMIDFWGYLNPSSTFDEWNPDEFGLTWTYGPFEQNEGVYSLTNTIKHNSGLTNYYTETTLNVHELYFLDHLIDYHVTVETDKINDMTTFSDVEASSTIGSTFTLPFGFTWETSVAAVADYMANQTVVAFHYEYDNTLTNGYQIDYVQDKLRKGLALSLRQSYHQYTQEDYEDESYWFIQYEATWFPFIIWRFNPSVRVIGFYSDGRDFKFLPSDEIDNTDPRRNTSDDREVADYFRGYLTRSDSSTLAYAEGYMPWGTIINLNLTFEFIDFGFAKSYATPFLDFGIFGDPDATNGYSIMSSVGLEGLGVLDSFPSHPVRIALGFNLFDIIDAMKGESDILDTEWEISIGFDLYF